MKIPRRLKVLSKADSGELGLRALKLNEEAGEVAEAVLRLLGRKAQGKRNTEELRMMVVEEVVDTIIMGMDLLTYLHYTDKKKLKTLINKKLTKWQNSVRLNPEQNK